MNMYLNGSQKEIIKCINDFLKENKTITLKDTNTTDCANIESVARKIEEYLYKNGFNLHVSRYFNGKTISNSKLEILDSERNPLYVYISTRKKAIDKYRVVDDKVTTVKQIVLGELKDISIQSIREYITYKYNLSLTYDCLSLS